MTNPVKSDRRAGFTIVELLIVIVVIAILATISIVAYNGVQQRVRDTKRKDDIAKIAKAFQLWAADTGKGFDTINAGSGGVALGWFDSSYAPYDSVASVLINSKYLNTSVVDPINKKTAGESYAYMIVPCNYTTDPQRIMLARLEVPPSLSVADQLGVTCSGSTYTSYTTTYGMNYAQMVVLK